MWYTFNRTSLESKPDFKLQGYHYAQTFNRTSLESKPFDFFSRLFSVRPF